MRSALAVSPPTDAAAALAVERIELRDFRNYRRLALQTGSSPVVLHGPNGAGKTNLLESISLLAPGRGLRQARLSDLDRRGTDAWSIVVMIAGRYGPLEVRAERERGADRRTLELDGHAQRSSNILAEHISVVWLTPAMERLFVEGSAERRRFLDRLVLAIDPAHARRVALYERTLRERSALLRSGRHEPDWLGALERRAAESGVAVAAARRELLGGLEVELAAQMLPFPRPRLALADEIVDLLDRYPAIEVEQRFAARLAGSRLEDARTGGAAIGPHRGDLEAFDRRSGEAVRLSSTGRQKAQLVSIVVAEALLHRRLHGHMPVLLFDEIAAHLDAGHRQDLFAVLADLRCQFWLTGTDRAIFGPLHGLARQFHVSDATLTADE